MKIVQINATCGSGSTGKICVAISKLLTESSIENYIFYSTGNSDYPLGICYEKPYEIRFGAIQARLLGNWGFESSSATRRMIAQLDKIGPDVVHLHNLHGHNCNLKLLFTYLNRKRIKIYWTFHDCWAFTGYCMHYDLISCERWQEKCCNCPQKSEYSWLFDRSSLLFQKKQRLFSNLDLTIIIPSQWLAGQVKQSFLKECTMRVIYNGIDLSIFQPEESDLKKRWKCENKYIVLGVAFDWGRRKGLDVFIELNQRLSADYQIVLVGTDDIVDKQLPEEFISIHRTHNQNELAQIYAAADLLVNPTREENFPTVNMESLACGTPVLTFRTGGSPEIIDESCGSVVEKDDIDTLEKEIIRICTTRPYSKENCIARAKRFDMNERFKEYIDLYVK